MSNSTTNGLSNDVLRAIARKGWYEIKEGPMRGQWTQKGLRGFFSLEYVLNDVLENTNRR